MTKQEAIEAMKHGHKVTHVYFTDDEWMTMQGNMICLEDGVKCQQEEFWRWREGEAFENGYSIFK